MKLVTYLNNWGYKMDKQIEKFYEEMEKIGGYTKPVDYIERSIKLQEKLWNPAFPELNFLTKDENGNIPSTRSDYHD